MKTRAFLEGLVLFCALAAGALRAEVEFAGYMRTAQGELRFVLVDPATKQTSDWIGIDARFGEYLLKSFDAKTETLAVEKAGVPIPLALKSATVRSPASNPAKSSPRYTLSSNTPPDVVAAVEAREKVARELLAQRQKALDRRAFLDKVVRLQAEETALRQRHPDGHPDLEEVRRKLKELEPQIAQNRVDQLQESRTFLLAQIRDPAVAPAQVEAARTKLAQVESALAREGAAPAK